MLMAVFEQSRCRMRPTKLMISSFYLRSICFYCKLTERSLFNVVMMSLFQ